MSDLRMVCGASMVIGGALGTVGPCMLRVHHDGPIHQDNTGAQWAAPPEPSPCGSRHQVLTFEVRVLPAPASDHAADITVRCADCGTATHRWTAVPTQLTYY